MKKIITMMLAAAVLVSALAGCSKETGDEAPDEVSAAASQKAETASSEAEEELSPEQLFRNAEGTLLMPLLDDTQYNDEAFKPVEVQGHIKLFGGSADYTCAYFITDDNVLYRFGDSDPLCTLEQDVEDFVPNVPRFISDKYPYVLVKNKDGSHTFVSCYGGEPSLPIKDETLVSVFNDYGNLAYYIEDNKLYCSELNDEGTVMTNDSPGRSEARQLVKILSFNGSVKTNIKEVHAHTISFFVIDTNNTLTAIEPDLYPDERRSGFDPIENVDRFFGECYGTLVGNFYYTKTTDDDKLFLNYREYDDESDTLNNKEYALPLPDGCKTEDITLVRSMAADNSVYLIANDKFYVCRKPMEDTTWTEVEEMSKLYKAGAIVSLSYADKGESSSYEPEQLTVLCSNGRLYRTNID